MFWIFVRGDYKNIPNICFFEDLMEYSCIMSPELSPSELRFCDIHIVIITKLSLYRVSV